MHATGSKLELAVHLQWREVICWFVSLAATHMQRRRHWCSISHTHNVHCDLAAALNYRPR